MCGIVGQARGGRRVDEALLERMCAALEHRGPDSRGVHLDDGRRARHPAAARHRPRHRRPADLQRGRLGRGRPQRRDLQLPRAARATCSARGHRFATAGRHRGDRPPLRGGRAATASTRLRGMFAFALWDARRRRLLLRPRPRRQEAALLRASAAGALASPPSSRALLAGRGRSRASVDPDALDAYLAYQLRARTRSARSAPCASCRPARTLRLARTARDRIERYWELDYAPKRRRRRAEPRRTRSSASAIREAARAG